MKKTIITFTILLFALPYVAHAKDNAARGVNPADNLTKIELLPQLRAFGDSSMTSLTLKYDKAIRKVFGINAELPLLRYSGYGASDNGIGDLTVRARAQHTWGRHTVIGAGEFILPTATENT